MKTDWHTKIRADLHERQTKQIMLDLSKELCHDNSGVEAVWDIVSAVEQPLSNRAAWLISTLQDMNPAIWNMHWYRMMQFIVDCDSSPIKRNVLRALALAEGMDWEDGNFFDWCIDVVYSADEDIAVRVHALTILHNYALQQPELAGEVSTILEDQLDHATSGLRSRIHRLQKSLATLK